jgi:hypothetical protein
MKNALKFWLESLQGGDYSEDLGVDWRIILKWIRKQGGRVWTGFIWLKVEIFAGLLNTILKFRAP